MIYFISDTHFADPRVLRIDRRPFPDMSEHDVALIRNWNATDGEEDEVWHLGDFISARGGECDQLLSRLNGRKHLIIGNNDPVTTTTATCLSFAITHPGPGTRWARSRFTCTVILTAG